jgi:hypothetical protein
MAVELLRKSQDLRWTEFDAETTAFAPVPINKDLTPELSCFGCDGSLWHSNLYGRAEISELVGANCPISRPSHHMKHSHGHFDWFFNGK